MGLSAAVLSAAAISSTAAIGSSYLGAQAQKSAGNKAIAEQEKMFNTLQGNLEPYKQYGLDSLSKLQGAMPGLTKPFDPSQLDQTPGYQFTKQQGMNAVNNSNSALGWGMSGPGAKGIADYVTGLADTTYGNQFDRYWGQNSNIFNMLMGPTQMGANAAGNVGQGALTTGSGIANTLMGIGNSQAGAYVGAANGISQAAQGPMNYMMLNSLLGQQAGGAATGMNPAFNDQAQVMYQRYGFNPLTPGTF